MAGGGLLQRPLAIELLRIADEYGLPLRAALEGEDDDALRPTHIAQPALLLVSAVLAAEVPGELAVAAVAGHSVGEYAACVAAGALRAPDAMRLVIERGQAMAAMQEGTMCALLGLDERAVSDVCAEAQRESGEIVVVANLNAPGQTVISGTVAGVDAAVALARSRGLRRAVPLSVSGAFHSPLMRDAAARFARLLDRAQLATARVPIVCNVDAEPVTAPDALRDRLRRQLTSPVRWVECVRRMAALGASPLVEVGPSGVLTGLARRIAPEVVATHAGTLEAVRGLRAAAAAT